ncbi:MAG: transporter [Neptuniibacter caesariensis]|uniref:Transporter n=1 Tax=Neptuniibacter caesariensis TaxID=207954 RepID=A0A2G6JAE7_NEPCE|nr:MAG: transporter [Neptuniibacter caesariensis]
MPIDLLLSRIFATVFPLVAIVSIGYFYAKRYPTNLDTANKINIDVFIPALIFSVLAAKSFNLPQFQSLAVGAAIVVLGSGLLLWPLCRYLVVNPKTFLPPMMFSNSGNLGLPLMVLAFGEQALPAAVVLFLVENVLHFTVGLYLLDHRTNPLMVLKMPMILATLAGLLVSLSGYQVPTTLMLPIEMLGQISIPLMLFALGVRMTDIDFSAWKIGLWGSLAAPVSGVLLAWAALTLLPIPQAQAPYLLLFGALPPAVLNFMIAERFRQEPHTVASIVLLGNLSALVTIPLALFFIL